MRKAAERLLRIEDRRCYFDNGVELPLPRHLSSTRCDEGKGWRGFRIHRAHDDPGEGAFLPMHTNLYVCRQVFEYMIAIDKQSRTP